MICKQCGALLKTTDNFCEYCGSANPDCVHYDTCGDNPNSIKLAAEITVPYYMLDYYDIHRDFTHSCRSTEVQKKLAELLVDKLYPLLKIKYTENIKNGDITFVTDIKVDRSSLIFD